MAKNSEKNKLTRLAIVDIDLCKPSECNQECRKSCPVNKIGKQCIKIEDKSIISEVLCIGCGACVKKCPFKAITIINLPSDLDKEISHRYSVNGFKLHRLPIPKMGKVVGLVGTNGVGKSTALKILSGEIKPNLGKIDGVDWMRVIENYKGSELHGYFTKLLEGGIETAMKIQYVDELPIILNSEHGSKIEKKTKKMTVGDAIKFEREVENVDEIVQTLNLGHLMNREIDNLSGGELQRLAIALTCMKNKTVYMFDEPSSYLDVKQRLNMSKAVRNVCKDDKYVIVVEHDLAILDLLSDYGCVLYGQSGAYGVITTPFSIKNAINIFLDGMIPTENMRFRQPLKFNMAEKPEIESSGEILYLPMKKTFDNFKLNVKGGKFGKSEIIVLLGENGMGKTTFIGLVSGRILQDCEECLGSCTCNREDFENKNYQTLNNLKVSLKPQKIRPKFKGTVRKLLMSQIKGSFLDENFQLDVVKPFNIDYLIDSQVESLSGGELQRIAIIVCLGRPADIYLIDEPSAYLDCEQRINMCRIIKNFMYKNKKTAFIVEHDLIVATYLADKVIVFKGMPGIESKATPPMDLETGMNDFLKDLNITFRRDPSNLRPRVNKLDSTKDREQKEKGKYFF
ncbi:Translation initiation factor RLI1 [Dictyocoela muelleri]|nr:Translation initiation factor RLI1 [Dictyocoela muelleri]